MSSSIPFNRIMFYQTGQPFDILSNVAPGGFEFNVNNTSYSVKCAEAVYQGLKGLSAAAATTTLSGTTINPQQKGHEILTSNKTGAAVQQDGNPIQNNLFIGKKDAAPNTIKEQLMHDILLCKITQNPAMLKALLNTGSLEIVENTAIASYNDDFWGNGQKYDGRNALGKLWMQVRSPTFHARCVEI